MKNGKLNLRTIVSLLVLIVVIVGFVIKVGKVIHIGSNSGPTGTTSANLKSYNTTANYEDDKNLSPNQCHYTVVDAQSGEVLPDRNCSPGSINSNVTQANISQTICKSGWTDTLRASDSQIGAAKSKTMLAYGITEDRTTHVVTYTAGGKTYTIKVAATSNTEKNGTVEFDHIVSLQLGGSNDQSNLYPEPPKSGAKGTTNAKDKVENKLNDAVCSGKITLAAAQSAIATNWTTAEQVLGLK